MIRPTIVAIILFVLTTTLAVPGCDRPSAERDLAQAVSSGISAYEYGNQAQRHEARQAIIALGNRAVPYLHHMLQSHDGLHHAAATALADIGSDEAYEVLIEALSGKTCLAPGEAAPFVSRFVLVNAWEPERARRVGGAAQVALRFLEATESTADRAAIRLAEVLHLEAAVPVLERIITQSDFAARRVAARAIYAITGEVVPVSLGVESFVSHSESADVCTMVSSFAVELPSISLARMTRTQGGSIEVIVAYCRWDNLCTDMRIFDLSGQPLYQNSIDGVLRAVCPVPEGAGGGQLYYVGILRRGRSRDNRLCAVSRVGKELWSIVPPEGTFRALSWLYGDGTRPSGVVASYSNARVSGHVALDLNGAILWQSDLNSRPFLDTSGCVPDQLLRSGGGVAYARVAKISYVPAKEMAPLMIGHGAGCCAIIPTGGGSCMYAVEVSGQHSQPGWTLLDSNFKVRFVCDLRSSVVGLGGVYRDCGEQQPLVVVFCENGELLAFDTAGVLRWRKQVAEERDVLFRRSGMHILKDTKGRATVFVTHWSNHVAIWQYNGDRNK